MAGLFELPSRTRRALGAESGWRNDRDLWQPSMRSRVQIAISLSIATMLGDGAGLQPHARPPVGLSQSYALGVSGADLRRRASSGGSWIAGRSFLSWSLTRPRPSASTLWPRAERARPASRRSAAALRRTPSGNPGQPPFADHRSSETPLRSSVTTEGQRSACAARGLVAIPGPRPAARRQALRSARPSTRRARRWWRA